MQDSYAHYYHASPVSSGDIGSTLLVLVVLGALIAAMIWLIKSKPPKKKPEKSLKEEIKDAFKGFVAEADTYSRPEVVRAMSNASNKIIEIVDKHAAK